MDERIGILGGTFNPPHIGHLIMAQDALELFALQKVLFVPASTPPHKRSPNLLPAEHRLAMLDHALQDDPRFQVCDDEIRRAGVSYSVETVRRLKAQYEGAQLFFIIGGDTLPELHTWKEIGALLALCEFITVARPGFDAAGLSAATLRLPPAQAARLIKNVCIGHLSEISSTDIRQRAARGQSIRYLVPAAVERYILDRKLYQQETPS
jgi:nicotinate-nucleotide adenylyltransferase